MKPVVFQGIDGQNIATRKGERIGSSAAGDPPTGIDPITGLLVKTKAVVQQRHDLVPWIHGHRNVPIRVGTINMKGGKINRHPDRRRNSVPSRSYTRHDRRICTQQSPPGVEPFLRNGVDQPRDRISSGQDQIFNCFPVKLRVVRFKQSRHPTDMRDGHGSPPIIGVGIFSSRAEDSRSRGSDVDGPLSIVRTLWRLADGEIP